MTPTKLAEAVETAKKVASKMRSLLGASYVYAENGTNPLRFTVEQLETLIEAAEGEERIQSALTTALVYFRKHDLIVEEVGKLILKEPPHQDAEVLVKALEEIREIYVGSEGFIAETAAEAYLQQEFRKQYDVAVEALTAWKGRGG